MDFLEDSNELLNEINSLNNYNIEYAIISAINLVINLTIEYIIDQIGDDKSAGSDNLVHFIYEPLLIMYRLFPIIEFINIIRNKNNTLFNKNNYILKTKTFELENLKLHD